MYTQNEKIIPRDIEEEVKEVRTAYKDCDALSVQHEAVDVANLALMVWWRAVLRVKAIVGEKP